MNFGSGGEICSLEPISHGAGLGLGSFELSSTLEVLNTGFNTKPGSESEFLELLGLLAS